METEAVPGGSRPGPSEIEGDQAGLGRGDGGDVWLLQAEAAELAGCSVSAIRKWRREGSVRFRRTTTPGGMERVEVRLGDVMARSGKRTLAASPPTVGAPVPPPPVAGTVLVSLADLEAMFARFATPDRSSDDLQARYRSLESEVSFIRGQVARLGTRVEERPVARARVEELERRISEMQEELGRLRRQLAAVTRQVERMPKAGRPPSQVPQDSPVSQDSPEPAPEQLSTAVPAGAEPEPEAEPPTFEGWLEGRTPPEKPAAPTGPPIERLAEELGRLYQTLSTRPRTPVGPEDRARWAAALRRYDTVLVRACSRLGVPTEHRLGDRLTAPDRVALTKALAEAGLDVRRSPANVEG